MKQIFSLTLALALCLSLCACRNGGSSDADGRTSSANMWTVEKLVDEFGDEVEGTKPILRVPFIGEFSNTATSGSDLAGYVFMYFRDGYPEFHIRLLEYGDSQIFYTGYDLLEFKIKQGISIVEFHPVLGNPPCGDLIIYDSTETLYTALYNGEDVRCIANIGSSKYSFTLSGSNFFAQCQQTGYLTQNIIFSTMDDESIYNAAKKFMETGEYTQALIYLEYLGDYRDCRDLLLETACNAYYYNQSGENYRKNNNAWLRFFDAATATPLTGEEIREIIVGDWRSRDGDTYSTYTADGKYSYTMGGIPQKDYDDVWFTENGRLIHESRYIRTERTIYPLFRNCYVFRTHQKSSDVYELYFRNGPPE